VKTLNIIGSGRVGRACGQLWARARVFAIQDVLTRTRQSAAEAVAFIGAGRAVDGLADMRGADVWMIATRDDAIKASCDTLAATDKIAPDEEASKRIDLSKSQEECIKQLARIQSPTPSEIRGNRCLSRSPSRRRRAWACRSCRATRWGDRA